MLLRYSRYSNLYFQLTNFIQYKSQTSSVNALNTPTSLLSTNFNLSTPKIIPRKLIPFFIHNFNLQQNNNSSAQQLPYQTPHLIYGEEILLALSAARLFHFPAINHLCLFCSGWRADRIVVITVWQRLGRPRIYLDGNHRWISSNTR